MAFRNKIVAKCSVCQEVVPVGTGWSEGPPWVTKCGPCSGRVETAPRIVVTLEGSNVAIKPSGYLNSSFSVYRTACEGARYDGSRNMIAVNKAAGILAKLAEAKFIVDVAPEVVKALQAASAQTQLSIQDAVVRADKIDEILKKRGKFLFPFQKTGVGWLAGRSTSLVADEMGLGKAQSLSASILTPKGWVTMGDIQVGDMVVGSDGKPTEVLGVYPQGEKDIFRVTFSDGSTTECCDEHLWQVNSALRKWQGLKPRVLPTSKIRETLTKSNGTRLHFVPMINKVEFEGGPSAIDPYLMGALLGDGGITRGVYFSTADAEMVEYIRKVLPDNHRIVYRSHDDWYIRGPGGRGENQILNELKRQGLFGKKSGGKFIPDSYKFVSSSARLQLLQGLLDTDGHVRPADNNIEYSSVSRQLALDVQFLVESLGGTARIRPKKTSGQLSYRMSIALPVDTQPFRLSRKASVYHTRAKYQPTRSIVSVDPVGRKLAQCIRVASSDHLYVTDRFIVTHNTIQILAALPDNAAVVAVCPSVAKGVWHREAQAWRPDFKVTILEGRGSFRWPEAGEIVVTNYDILPSVTDKNVNGFATPVLSDELVASCPHGCVIIADEGHALKNSQAMRSRKWRGMRDATLAHDGRVWVATATPLLNMAPELWAVLQAAGCANDAFGSFKQFVSLMGGYEGSYGMEWGTIPDPAEIGRRLQRVMLRRLRTEVLPELPVKTYRTINVPVDAKTAKLCDAVLKVLSERGMDLDVIQQTENGADFTEMSRARAALATAKIPALLELIESYEEQEEPVVVFSAHRAPIDTLSTRPGWAVITGDTKPEDRTRIENDFQAGKLKGVAATIKAGGVAITLTRSHHAIKVDEEWTPALNAQAEDRICRIGQDRGCIITSLVGDHDLDRRIYELLAQKRTVIEGSVEQGRMLPTAHVMTEVVEINYSKLAAEAQALKDAESKAQADAQALAAERALAAEKIREENAKKEQERKEREAAEKKERKARERAMARGWVVSQEDPERRDAQTPREHWAVRALAQLSGNDPDFAKEQNGVGFNKSDAVIGHWMNEEIVNGLTPAQWKIVIKLCTKYQGQVGSPPSDEEPCTAAS